MIPASCKVTKIDKQGVGMTAGYVDACSRVPTKATWLLFVPFNVVNFTLIPVRHQAAVLACFSFVYQTTLSAIANAEAKGGGWVLDLLLGPRARAGSAPHKLKASVTGGGC